MSIKNRIIRSMKELAGVKQWPRMSEVCITNQDELFLSKLIQPGDVVFDIGSNHGSLACYMASLCGVNGKVVAFEPVWRTYERMCERLQSESLQRAPIVTVPLGLSSQPEIVEIHLPDGCDALASIAPGQQVEQMCTSAFTRTLKCGVITLDLFMTTTGIQQPAVVKIDVEGAEYKVIRGGRTVLEHNLKPVLFIEVVAPWLKKFGHSPWDVLGYLQTLGYRHLFMCPQGLVEHHATQDQAIPEEFLMGYNVISVVPGQHDAIIDRLEPYLADKMPALPPMDPSTVKNLID